MHAADAERFRKMRDATLAAGKEFERCLCEMIGEFDRRGGMGVWSFEYRRAQHDVEKSLVNIKHAPEFRAEWL